MTEMWFQKVDREAAERLQELMALPSPEDKMEVGSDGFFDPWPMFQLYGSYSSDFDECATEVLEEILSGEKNRDDLAAEMFREMLCKLHLCDYGTSPRVCFPTSEFRALLPGFIEKWKAYSKLQWEAD